MDTLPADLFTDPVWHALTSQHSHLAVIEGDARRYPVNVAPFAALATLCEISPVAAFCCSTEAATAEV